MHQRPQVRSSQFNQLGLVLVGQPSLEHVGSTADTRKSRNPPEARDRVIEVYDQRTDPESLVAVLLGEFKYSSSKDRFMRGLEELVHYRNFAKHQTDTYISDGTTVPILGLLVTDGVGITGSSGDIIQLDGSDLPTIDLANIDMFDILLKKFNN